MRGKPGRPSSEADGGRGSGWDGAEARSLWGDSSSTSPCLNASRAIRAVSTPGWREESTRLSGDLPPSGVARSSNSADPLSASWRALRLATRSSAPPASDSDSRSSKRE